MIDPILRSPFPGLTRRREWLIRAAEVAADAIGLAALIAIIVTVWVLT